MLKTASHRQAKRVFSRCSNNAAPAPRASKYPRTDPKSRRSVVNKNSIASGGES